MGDYEQTLSITADADRVFAFLSDVSNLPQYFDSMTSAEPAGGEAVHTTADVEGREVEGEAWFRVDDDRHTIAWGAPGGSDYSGELELDDDGELTVLTVRLHTERVDDGSIDDSLKQTLENIRRLCEEPEEADE